MRTLLTACTAALLLCATHASADNFPSKPVKVIVTFTVGGAADLTARLIGDRHSRIDCERHRRRGGEPERHEIVDDVEWQVGIESGVERMRASDEQ